MLRTQLLYMTAILENLKFVLRDPEYINISKSKLIPYFLPLLTVDPIAINIKCCGPGQKRTIISHCECVFKTANFSAVKLKHTVVNFCIYYCIQNKFQLNEQISTCI